MTYVLLPPFPMYPAGDSYFLNPLEMSVVTPDRSYRFCLLLAKAVFPTNTLSLFNSEACIKVC